MMPRTYKWVGINLNKSNRAWNHFLILRVLVNIAERFVSNIKHGWGLRSSVSRRRQIQRGAESQTNPPLGRGVSHIWPQTVLITLLLHGEQKPILLRQSVKVCLINSVWKLCVMRGKCWIQIYSTVVWCDVNIGMTNSNNCQRHTFL